MLHSCLDNSQVSCSSILSMQQTMLRQLVKHVTNFPFFFPTPLFLLLLLSLEVLTGQASRGKQECWENKQKSNGFCLCSHCVLGSRGNTSHSLLWQRAPTVAAALQQESGGGEKGKEHQNQFLGAHASLQTFSTFFVTSVFQPWLPACINYSLLPRCTHFKLPLGFRVQKPTDQGWKQLTNRLF